MIIRFDSFLRGKGWLLGGSRDVFRYGFFDGRLDDFVKTRYATYDTGIGQKIESGSATFEDLEKFTLETGEPKIASGRQEMLENLVNEFI